MPLMSFGDTAQGLILHRNTTALKTDLAQRNEELATGRVADMQSHLRGDFSELGAIETALARNSAAGDANIMAGRFASAQQLALDTIRSTLSSTSNDLIHAAQRADATSIATASDGAMQALDALVGQLNSTSAGRAMFGGVATQSKAVAAGSDIVTAIEAKLDPATLTADTAVQTITDAVDQWFAAPDGFAEEGYLGSTTRLDSFDVGTGDRVSLDLQANDPALRDALKSMVLAVVATGGILNDQPEARNTLMAQAGARLTSSAGEVTLLQSQLGRKEGLIEAAAERQGAERNGLRVAREALIGADPYETATALTEIETRLQSVYTMTSRLSRLSLASVL